MGTTDSSTGFNIGDAVSCPADGWSGTVTELNVPSIIDDGNTYVRVTADDGALYDRLAAALTPKSA